MLKVGIDLGHSALAAETNSPSNPALGESFPQTRVIGWLRNGKFRLHTHTICLLRLPRHALDEPTVGLLFITALFRQ